ncbi:hypothetical protein [Paraburkholderia sp. MM6662-R1]|uniref:hypothetical protein n=1 Tax=Paraburkholderia sp. MM6662-R1 TaxID=2991066 RepID=UPI003D256E10
METRSWRRVALLGAVLILHVGLSHADSVSAQCPGYDGDGPYPKFSAQKTANWESLNLGKIVISKPSLEEVQVHGERHFKVTLTQIMPQCYVSGHVYAEVFNNGHKSQEVQLFGVVGAVNRPDPPQRFELISAQAIAPNVTIDENTQVNLSLDCGCIKDPGKPIQPTDFMIPLGQCDTDFNCQLPFGAVWTGVWPHR